MYPRVHAGTTPDKPAVLMADGDVVTYAELADRAARLARLWWSRGLRPGDQVSIWAENHARYHEVYWAAMHSGLYLTGITRLATAEEAAYILRDSGSTVLVASHTMREVAAAAADLVPECAVRLMFDGTVEGFESYEDAIAAEPAEPLDSEPRGEVMLYSSGTTGRPKGIRRALSGFDIDDPGAPRTSGLGSGLLGMDADTVYLAPAPLYHAAALMWSAGIHELGGTVVVMERFDAAELLRLVETHRVTHTQVVPTMMVRMLKLPDDVRARHDLTSLRCLLHAAAPCPPEVKRQMIDWLGPIVDEYYSATEGHGMTFVRAAEWLERPGTVGRAVLGTAHVCDDEGREVPPGTIGTIYFDHPERPFSYHQDPAKTEQAHHPTHPTWSTVGDLGHLDEDGYLFLADRRSFLIISGGVNIYPAEVEACLVVHPQVHDVVVFGAPDPEMGEHVHAVVEPAPGVAAGPELREALLAHAREHLSRHKLPRVVHFTDEIPRMPTGKVNTAAVRERFVLDPT